METNKKLRQNIKRLKNKDKKSLMLNCIHLLTKEELNELRTFIKDQK
jgi:hypothetical protein